MLSDAAESGALDVPEFQFQLTKAEMEQIRDDILGTTRPVWHAGPPSSFGSKGHGKLKADQWRSSIEFDIPVSLVSLLDKSKQLNDLAATARCQKLVDSTMLLATAIRWATSHQTSPHHAAEYKRYMQAYLDSIKKLDPGITLRPNHHNALHLGDFLLLFGPMHSWWMFPFERVIGTLQGINHNSKLGKHVYLSYNIDSNYWCWRCV